MNGEDIREVARRNGLAPGKLAEVLDPAKMTGATDEPPVTRPSAER